VIDSKLSILFVISILVVVPVYGDEASDKEDLERHQGTWTIVWEEYDGERLPRGESVGLTRIVKGHEATRMKGQEASKSILRLDSSKQPRQYDAEIVDGPNTGQIIRGIYEFDGDYLKMCSGAPGKARPREFITSPGSGLGIQVWRRTRP
jgi:uncharacterized protein (TIGR03067 family)